MLSSPPFLVTQGLDRSNDLPKIPHEGAICTTTSLDFRLSQKEFAEDPLCVDPFFWVSLGMARPAL